MAVVKKISELTAKGSNIGANDLVIVGVSNGTDYDLKSVTGNQLVGAAVAQTITNGVTTTAPSQDAVYDALANKVDVVAGSRLITSAEATSISDIANKAPLASPTFTGTVTLPSDTSIGTVSSSELGYLDGVASSVQNQLNNKANLNTLITPGTATKVTYDAKGMILSGTNITTSDVSGLGTLATQSTIPVVIQLACSDETTALTAGTSKVTFRMPHAMTLTEVRASLNVAGTTSGITTIDINEGGVSILSTKLTIDLTEKTSTTAVTPAVISDASLADDAEITIDIDAISGGATEKGLKITLIGTRTV